MSKKIVSKLSKAQRRMLLGETRGTQVNGEVRLALFVDPDAWKTRNALQMRGLITGRAHNHDAPGYERVLLTPLGEQVRALLKEK